MLLRYKIRLLIKYVATKEIEKFDLVLMMAVMEKITAFEDGRLQIKFYDSAEVEAAIK